MSSSDHREPSAWLKRRLDPDTLANTLGWGGVIIGIFAVLNPTLLLILGYKLGVGAMIAPNLWGISSIALGVLMLVIPSSRAKRWVMLGSVLYWVFIALAFIWVSPYQPPSATGFAVWAALTSIAAYWRSWVWG